MKSFKKTVNFIADILERILITLAVTVLFMLVITVSLQVFIRYALDGSLPWVHEVSSGLLIWLTFIGSAYLVRGNRHLRVDMLIVKAPNWVQRVVNVALDFLNMIFVIILVYVSFQLLDTQMQATLGVLGMPRAVYFAIPILIFAISTPVYLVEAIIKELSPTAD